MAIRIGMIGAGRLGRSHLESLATLPEAQVVAVCDSDRGRAEAAAQPFGAGVHISFRTMLEAGRLDALFICLPPFARGEPETAAARAGIHLFVEPPVALNAEKARQIQKEIEKAGVVASVAYSWRHLSNADRARELLQDRKIALVRGWAMSPLPRAGWRRRKESSGGLFFHEATNLFDLARYLAGEITSVCAVPFQGIAASRLAEYDIEDAFAAVLRFRSGATGDIVASDISPLQGAALAVLAENLELWVTPEALEIIEAGKRTRLEHAGSPLHAAQKAFLEAVKAGNPGLVRSGYADAVRSLQVSLAANESAQSGKVVSL